MASVRTPILVVIVLLVSVAPIHAQTATNLDSRWADLASGDEGKATRALLALAATPKETTAYLKDNLMPVKADPKRVAQLIKQLDSSNFVVRQKAMNELEYFGKYIKAELEAGIKEGATVEAKMRMQQLIEKMPVAKKEEPMPLGIPKARPGGTITVSNVNGQITILVDGKPINMAPPAPLPPPGPPTHWLRAVKAIMILEHIGTPEARQVIEAMAAGESDALPTIAAREALDRLKK
jgi:hypothetical protein